MKFNSIRSGSGTNHIEFRIAEDVLRLVDLRLLQIRRRIQRRRTCAQNAIVCVAIVCGASAEAVALQ